jgi:hypothetical protein
MHPGYLSRYSGQAGRPSNRGSITDKKNNLFLTPSNQYWGPSSLLSNEYRWVTSTKLKWSGCEADHSTPSKVDFLDNRLKDGSEIVSLTRRLPFTTRKIPGTYFC